jgi:hypothetical protein
MGGGWRMPTYTEGTTLLSNVNTRSVKYKNGSSYIRGVLLTDKNDTTEAIFMPAGGYYPYNRRQGLLQENIDGTYYLSTSGINGKYFYGQRLFVYTNNGTANCFTSTNNADGISVRGVHA